MAMNAVCLTGRLTHNPELKSTGGGKMVCSFVIAVEDEYDRQRTHFFKIVAWEKTGEFVSRYFTKGKAIGITGSLAQRNYETRSGDKREAIEVIAQKVSFIGNKDDNQQYVASAPEPPPAPTKPAYRPQQQSMMAGQHGEQFAANADFDEITGEDDLPF